MAGMSVYSLTAEEIEELADVIKVSILRALIKGGLIEEQAADDWAITHTVITRRKTIFRTLTTLWKNTEEIDGLYYLVVEIK